MGKKVWQAYDVAAKMKVNILEPKAVKMKNGRWAIKGKSSKTGNVVYRIAGNDKPVV